jgi:hypothetical protein
LTIVSPAAVDWDEQASKAARDHINEAGREGAYRDLAGLSAQQKQFLERTQIQPVPHNPFWDDKSRLDIPGGFWTTDNCAVVNLLPACRIKWAKRKARGDLFEDMKTYLDERDSNPLP